MLCRKKGPAMLKSRERMIWSMKQNLNPAVTKAIKRLHSPTVKPDIRGCCFANVRKVTCSRVSGVVTSMSAMADDLPI